MRLINSYNMRKIFFLLAAFLGVQNIWAQSMSEAMTSYRDACLKMLEGIGKNYDKYILWEAVEMYDNVRISWFAESDYMPKDMETLHDELPPALYFVPEFADSLIVTGGLVSLDEISAVRGRDFDVCILHKGIKAKGTLVYEAAGAGDCEMMVLGETGADLKLTITDLSSGTVHEGGREYGGMVSCVNWTMPATGAGFLFKIENCSDHDISMVIAVN